MLFQEIPMKLYYQNSVVVKDWFGEIHKKLNLPELKVNFNPFLHFEVAFNHLIEIMILHYISFQALKSLIQFNSDTLF